MSSDSNNCLYTFPLISSSRTLKTSIPTGPLVIDVLESLCITYLPEMLQARSIPYHIFMEIGNTEIIKRFVASGLCLSVLPLFTIQNELNNNILTTVNLSDFHLTMYSQVFYHKNKVVTLAMSEFLKCIPLH